MASFWRRCPTTPAALLLALLIALAALPSLAAAAPPPGEGELTITPAAVGFDATTIGSSSAEQQIEVHNESAATVTISNVGLQGAEPAEFATGSNSCIRTLASGESCSIGVYFSPHGEGAKEAQVQITSSDVAGEENVELTGTGAAPQVSFEPGSYDFGLQPTHGEGDAETEFQLRNSGAATIQISGVDIEGPGSNSFNTGNSDCFGAYLSPGQTCFLQIRFRPQETIPYAVSLRVSANGANFTAALSGEGGEAIITATPSPLQFGTAALGSPGLTQTITLANSGDLPQGFFIAFLTGGDVSDFQLLSEDCTTGQLDPGSTCAAKVRFAPQSLGAKSAKLSFIAGGEGGPLQIDLNGTGIGTQLSLSPTGLAFGNQPIDSSGQARAATLTNAGSAPIEVDAASILGPGSDQFRLSDSCSGTVLAPGASCQATVRFAPDGEGTKSATLRVLAGGQRLSASLSGTGVAPARVALRLRPRPLRFLGASLNVGRLSCDALQSCTVAARATITVRVRVGRRARTRTAALRTLRLSLPAQGSGALRLHLTPAARRLLAAGSRRARLRLHLRRSAEGQTESSRLRLSLISPR